MTQQLKGFQRLITHENLGFDKPRQMDEKDKLCLSKLRLQINSQAPEPVRVQRPVSPDLAKTVKARSDRSEILTNVFGGAENGNFSQKSPNIF